MVKIFTETFVSERFSVLIYTSSRRGRNLILIFKNGSWTFRQRQWFKSYSIIKNSLFQTFQGPTYEVSREARQKIAREKSSFDKSVPRLVELCKFNTKKGHVTQVAINFFMYRQWNSKRTNKSNKFFSNIFHWLELSFEKKTVKTLYSVNLHQIFLLRSKL